MGESGGLAVGAAGGDRLSSAAASYVAAARAESTRRGYRTDMADFEAWAGTTDPWPASPAAVAEYISAQARAGAATGTISRRLSTLRVLHRLRGWADPTAHPLVEETWRGIRREHGRQPVQARPLMPPELWDVLEACPRVRRWADKRRPAEDDVAGARDRALVLTGFVGALRRSEIAALDVVDVADHEHGLVLSIPRSKTNQTGERAELVVLPRSPRVERCPVRTLLAWLKVAGIDRDDTGPLFRSVSKGNRPLPRRLSPGGLNVLVQTAVERAGIDPDGYSAHSLRAGFVTYADLEGAPVQAIMHQTRHRSPASVAGYVRVEDAWRHNAATMLHL